jgi:putative flippase GtrA
LDLIVSIFRRAPAKHPVAQFVRYGIVAGCGYILAIVFYTGELAAGIDPYLALGIAFVLNGIFNFSLIRIWAFPPSGRTARSDLGRFCVVAAISFAVNYASFAVLYSAIGLAPATAQRLAILIAAPVTFIANRLWSFRSSLAVARSDSESEAAASIGDGRIYTSVSRLRR